jgi:hypothetical protein
VAANADADDFPGMTSDELRAKWRRTEAYLRAALAAVDLPDHDRQQIEEFLDHNELGVAFEWLVSRLAEAHASLPTELHSNLAAAASETGLEDNPDWRALQPAPT